MIADSERHLHGDQTVTEMRTSSVRAVAAMMISQVCQLGLLFGINIIMARLLMPEDFGVVAIVTSITAFFSLFNDLGLPMATVQRHEINHEQVSLLFWINTLWGCALAALVAATAPLFAKLYGDPRLTSIIAVLAISFLFIGLGSQHRALLKRQMRFTRLAVIELLAILPGMVVALMLAWLGFRYWALVYMRLATIIFSTLGVMLACGWRPGRPRRTTQMRPLLIFGTHLTGFSVMAYLTRNVDNLLIGWYNGARALGLYSKAYQMLLVPAQQFSTPLAGVVVPTLSRLQLDPQRYNTYYHRSILLSAAFGMPLIAFLFVSADWVVPLLLGSQWVESVPFFRALALAAFISPVDFGSGWIVISMGRTGRQLKWTPFATIFTLLGFFVGIRWGTVGVAMSFSLCRAILLIPKLIYSAKESPIRWIEVFQNVSRPAIAALLAAAALFALTRQLSLAAHGLAGLAVGSFFFALMYIGIWLALPGGRRTLWSLISLVRYLR
jgi:O-antigen/teichoic acid export membrane protein